MAVAEVVDALLPLKCCHVRMLPHVVVVLVAAVVVVVDGGGVLFVAADAVHHHHRYRHVVTSEFGS